jgi:hypothetical protein
MVLEVEASSDGEGVVKEAVCKIKDYVDLLRR